MKYICNEILFELCQHDKVPIIREKTAALIFELINKNSYQSILEIGTAYGFSTLIWNQANSIQSIVSIEKNVDSYCIAKQYLNNEQKITLINDDAFEYLPKKQFDVIFLDGPKSHQEKLVEKYLNYLNKNGVIIIDNLFLKKYANKPIENLTKNQKKLLVRVNNFRKWLENNQINFVLSLYDIDDGVGIISKHAK